MTSLNRPGGNKNIRFIIGKSVTVTVDRTYAIRGEDGKRQGSGKLQEYITAAAEYTCGRAAGAVCAGRRIQKQGRQRSGPKHSGKPDRAYERETKAFTGRRSVQGRAVV